MSVVDIKLEATEFECISWDHPLASPDKDPPKNIRRLILDFTKSGILSRVLIVNSKHLANPKCFGLPRIYFFENRIVPFWYAKSVEITEHVDCITDACIRSSDVGIFFVLTKPPTTMRLEEAGYIGGSKVKLFHGERGRDYFLDSYGQKLRSIFTDFENFPPTVGHLLFFHPDAEFVVVTSR